MKNKKNCNIFRTYGNCYVDIQARHGKIMLPINHVQRTAGQLGRERATQILC